MRRLVAFGVLIVLLASTAFAEASPSRADAGPPSSRASWNDQARFLAGLPVSEGSPLAPLTETPAWKAHAAALDAGFATLAEHRLGKMDAWAQTELLPHLVRNAPLVYLFGGPDFISADVLYPDAPIYVLAGLEKVGGVPPLEALPEKELEQGLTNLRATLKTTINLSYFVTSVMGPDMKKTRLRGVLPVLLLFLARHQDTVVSVEHVALDKAGVLSVVAPSAVPPTGVPGLRIRFQRLGQGPVRELDYFSNDVHNDALPLAPGLFPFLSKLGTVNAFLKAASFILHDRHFSVAREYLLQHAATVLQDDSGLPYRFLSPKKWDLTFFGEYTPNKKVFEDHFQTDLKAAWDKAPVKPLPFATGYPHQRGSNLELAVQRPPATDAGTAP